MNEVLVQCDSITVLYHGRKLFDGLTLHISSGEILVITGSAGSGKTALLESIAGKWPVVKGKIVIRKAAAKPPTDGPSCLLVSTMHDFRNLSNTRDLYYQQRYNSYDSEDSPTVGDYLQDHLLNGQDAVREILSRLKIEHLENQKLIMLSSGETRKVLLAAALLKNPDILLLDNILSGLDAASRDYFNELFIELAEEGTAIVLTSSIDRLPPFATRILELTDNNISEFKSKESSGTDGMNIASVHTNILEILQSIPPIEVQFDSLIKMINVQVKYGDKIVLKDINWEVKPGERWALTGANGSGKTTLLSLINGDNPQAYSNNISLFDRKRGSGESIWDIKKKIGFVSPELHQYFPRECTCVQAVESGFYDTLGLFRKSSKHLAAIAQAWLKVVQLDSSSGKLLTQLSYKEQRLCLLARALVKRPPLLILDEPFQGFDQREIDVWKSLLDMILSSTKTALIMVSHYITDFPSSVDRHIRLSDGEIDYCGEFLPSAK